MCLVYLCASAASACDIEVRFGSLSDRPVLLHSFSEILYVKHTKSTSPSLEQLAVRRRFVDLYRTDVDLCLIEVVNRYSVRALGRVDISILRGMNYRSAANADSEKVLLKSLQKIYAPPVVSRQNELPIIPREWWHLWCISTTYRDPARSHSHAVLGRRFVIASTSTNTISG